MRYLIPFALGLSVGAIAVALWKRAGRLSPEPVDPSLNHLDQRIRMRLHALETGETAMHPN